jgi:hypothetical protein
LAQTARSGMVVALGLSIPLLASGLVEAFVTPAPVPLAAKLAIGAVFWLSFLAYVLIFGVQAEAAGLSSDVAAHEQPADAPTV